MAEFTTVGTTDLERLIEASSLGTSEAVRLRESVPIEVAREVVARSNSFAMRTDHQGPGTHLVVDQ